MADDVISLEIATPVGNIFQEKVHYVQLPVENGSLGVLPGHIPMMTTISTGVLKYENAAGEDYVAVSEGFAEVKRNQVIVLTNTAEDAAHIDLARAEAALNRAQERLSHKEKNIVSARAEASLRRAVARINAYRQHQKS